MAGLALHALACVAFLRITRIAFPGSEHEPDRALLTALFALHPAVLASVVQPNIDLPMLPAFLWSIVFIVRRRWIPLVLVGTALVLAKESGVLLYAVLLFSYAVSVVLPGATSSRSPISALRKLLPLAIPIGVFAAYIAYRIIIPHAVVLSAAGTTDKSILYQFLVPRIDPYFISYSAIIFVLNFAWVLATVLALDVAGAVLRRRRKRHRQPIIGTKRLAVRLLVVLGVTTMYALTRYSSYANTRYLLPVFALLPLMSYPGIVRLAVRPWVRRTILSSLVVLGLVSSVRSIDPVSRRIYGTFAFGEHAMLRMTRLTRECCGAGQDQLAYSLEFSVLSDLTSEVTQRVVTDSTAIIVPPRMVWQPVGRVDRLSRRRTLALERSITPPVLGADSLSRTPDVPALAIYLALPNGDVAGGRKLLQPWYEIGDSIKVRRRGYELTAYSLVRKSAMPGS
jgi:hypothetical protein